MTRSEDSMSSDRLPEREARSLCQVVLIRESTLLEIRHPATEAFHSMRHTGSLWHEFELLRLEVEDFSGVAGT